MLFFFKNVGSDLQRERNMDKSEDNSKTCVKTFPGKY